MKLRLSDFAPWIGFVFGLVISCLLAFFFKENPLHVLQVLVSSFINSKFDFGLTLFYTTCLIFAGLSFSIPLKAGLFHIGCEGQILFSALVAAVVGIYFNMGFLGHLFLVFFLTSFAGIASAGVIAFFKIYRNAHEVVVAIMLNFIFAALTTWITVNSVQNPASQNPESALIAEPLQFLKNDFLKNYFDQSAVSVFFIFAVVICVILYFLEKKTLLGFQLKAFGANPAAAQRMGISSFKIISISMGLAGFFSAMVALSEVLGNSFQYKIGFSPEYGFLGIAVALLARQNLIGIIFSAFLMACLHKGASDLDLETQFLTRDFSKILQALIIFSVAASYSIFEILKKRLDERQNPK